MTNRSSINSPQTRLPSLVEAVARCGIRRALRSFLRSFDLAYVAILHVPEGTAGYYRRAAAALVVDPAPTDSFGGHTSEIFVLNDRLSSLQSIYDHLNQNRQIVILVEDMAHVTPELVAAADIITDVSPPTIPHFVAAAKTAGIPGMTEAFAEVLVRAPFDAIATAARRTRPLASTVREIKKLLETKAISNAVAETPKGPRLEDSAGYGAAKDWGMQLAEDLKAWREGRITWDDVDRGALLFGPPGCGKTRYAEALANTCGVKLVIASAARWQANGHLGDFLQAMRSAFKQARKDAPSILFVDEFDSFGDREAGGDGDHRDYRRQVINGLLECLDPAEGREGVVVVGATNDPSVIDRALLRSGRLETQIEIPLPDTSARVAILRHHLATDAIGAALPQFASASRGWSGADIAKFARDARRIARRKGVTIDEQILMEAMPERYALTDDEMRRIAIHEVGHALVGTLLGSETVVSVSIARDMPVSGGNRALGLTSFVPQRVGHKTAQHYDNWIAMLLAGTAAELVVLGDRTDGAGGAASSDLMQATDVATRLERQFGLGESLFADVGKGDRPLEYLRSIDPELRSLVDRRLKTQLDRATELIEAHRPKVDKLVDLLLSTGFVTGAVIRDLIGQPTTNAASVETRRLTAGVSVANKGGRDTNDSACEAKCQHG